jgi:hypothetical protein
MDTHYIIDGALQPSQFLGSGSGVPLRRAALSPFVNDVGPADEVAILTAEIPHFESAALHCSSWSPQSLPHISTMADAVTSTPKISTNLASPKLVKSKPPLLASGSLSNVPFGCGIYTHSPLLQLCPF